MSYNLPS